jgi:hypothetical protein
MRKGLVVLSLLFAMNVSADQISLFDWGLYLNGTVTRSIADLPGNVTISDGFFETGLGTITMSFESVSPTNISTAMFFDYEIDEQVNTFFNEYGITGGTSVDPRLTYEIDEPGFSTGDYIGDIYDNFLDFSNRGLDNKTFYDGYTNTNLSDFESPISDDVSMAMGWQFALNGNETAVLEYTVSSSTPETGFYLAHMDHNSLGTGIYLQSRLNTSSVNVNVPEPSAFSSLGIGIIFLLFFYRRQKKALVN